MADDAAEQWGAEVIVTMKDGRSLSRRVDNLVGRGGDNPMTPDELWDKFSDCAGRSLPREQIAPLFERLETLETARDVNLVTQLAEVRRRPGGRPAARSTLQRAGQGAPESEWVP